MNELSAKDQLDIKRLYSDFGKLLDAGAINEWITCFSDNGSFRLTNGRVLNGPRNLIEFAVGHHERMKHLGMTWRHSVSNVIVTIDAQEVSGTCTSELFNDADDSTTPILTAHYVDLLVHQDNVWKFRSRTAYTEKT